jgi:acetamidase/formamidase
MPRTHDFEADRIHYTWDVQHEPGLVVDSGDVVVVVHTREVSDGQITPTSTARALAGIDWARVYPLAGPIQVEGAEPGDVLSALLPLAVFRS